MKIKEQIQIVDSWLKDISKALDVTLSLDAEGICSFQVGENIIAIEVSQDFPMVYLYSPLLALPLETQEATTHVFAKALELNVFQSFTRGGAIAMAPGGGFLIYCYSTPIEGLNAEGFSKILGGFFETIPELKKLLSQSSTILPGKQKDFLGNKLKI